MSKDQCHLQDKFFGSFEIDFLIIISLYKDVGSVMEFEGSNNELESANV